MSFHELYIQLSSEAFRTGPERLANTHPAQHGWGRRHLHRRHAVREHGPLPRMVAEQKAQVRKRTRGEKGCAGRVFWAGGVDEGMALTDISSEGKPVFFPIKRLGQCLYKDIHGVHLETSVRGRLDAEVILECVHRESRILRRYARELARSVNLFTIQCLLGPRRIATKAVRVVLPS